MIPEQNKWSKRFMEMAELVASWSKDPTRQVGCVIVDDDHRVISVGYNGFPRGVKDCCDRYIDRETKYLFVSHAERNAIDNAPMSVKGCTLYTPLEPCNECAKAIIQNGITKVITYKAEEDYEAFRWDITRLMFHEAGVQIYYLPKE